ncbi:hypothetical protein Ae201684P_000175 [Aphanomyces euteiches]|nr:hypothetical protein Ae201684P_000175 [Aphanomyces euteiches]
MADHQDCDVISITTLQGREFHQNNETEQEEEVPAVTTAAPAQTQTMANTPPWPHAHHDMTPQRQTFTQRGPQGPESYNGTMSVGNSIQLQRSAQQVRTTSQGPTLFQVYHNAQRHVHQNIYVQRSDDLGETQQALMQAHLERQRREYEFQLELQRRDRHEHNILQEARHHVQAQAREAEFTRQQDYWQYAGQAQMNQMAYQQQFEEHLRQRQEAMDREYQTKCQALEEAKQAWIRQMATQNTAARSGNQRGEANIDVPSAPEDIPKESKEKAKVLKEIQKGAKETPKQAVKQAPAVGEKRTPKCWNCGGDHNLRSCTKASEAEKEAIAKKKMAEWKAEEAARGSKPKSKTLAMDGINGGSSVSTVRGAEDVGEIPILFVTGSDPSALISRGLLELLEQTTMLDLHLVESTNAREMLGFGHVPINVSRHVILEAIDICTPEGPLTLLNINPWVEEEEEGLAITIGRPVMNTLGYDTGEFLSRAQKKRATWNLKGLLAEDIGTSTMVQKSLKMQHYEKEMLDKSDDSDDEDLAPGVTGAAKVKLVLAQKVEKAANRGMSTAGLARLTQLLKKFEDVFRVDFASDPPVRVKPLVVRIKPDAVPLRCKTRRYAPSQMDYIRKHFAELLKYGLATKNKDSRWASPPRVVPKKNGEWRMTVDLRGVNTLTLPLQWPMPVLEVVLARLAGVARALYYHGN